MKALSAPHGAIGGGEGWVRWGPLRLPRGGEGFRVSVTCRTDIDGLSLVELKQLVLELFGQNEVDSTGKTIRIGHAIYDNVLWTTGRAARPRQ